MDAEAWAASSYKPTPTIVEAAQALYSGHDVREISRSEAGADCFIGGRNAEGKAMAVGVKEKPDTIHLANPLHAA